MDFNEIINARVHSYYWIEDLNCSKTILKTLTEIFNVNLSSQVLNSATGLPDKGKFNLQCGLVNGSLLFIGIIGSEKGMKDKEVEKLCHNYIEKFQGDFGSLTCKGLRPQGFKQDNPPHLCENLTKKAISFTASYILNMK